MAKETFNNIEGVLEIDKLDTIDKEGHVDSVYSALIFAGNKDSLIDLAEYIKNNTNIIIK